MRPEQANDQIFIRGLVVASHIGVPERERAHSQDLLVTLVMTPKHDFSVRPPEDDIERTIDYHAVSIRTEDIAAARPRKLIETLAEDIAGTLIEEFAIASITVEIEKFILPNTRCVGVTITRFAGDAPGD